MKKLKMKPPGALKMPEAKPAESVFLQGAEHGGNMEPMKHGDDEVVLGTDRLAGDPLKREKRRSTLRSSESGIMYSDLEVDGVVGRGSFGVVKRVRHKSGAVYVLKEVQNKKAISRELLPLLASDVPHCVSIYDAFVNPKTGTCSILMEYMDYGSVKSCHDELQSKSLSMSYADIGIIAHSSLQGLQALRELHIVHRDIKPANILIGQGGVVKIGDFGLSTFTNAESLAVSHSGSLVWMAPERVRNQEHSYPADVFSLGLSVHFLATGAPPSYHDMVLGMYEALDVSSISSEPFRDFISKATLLNPAERPTAKDLLEHPFLSDAAGDSAELSFLVHLGAHSEACKRPKQQDPRELL